MAELTDKLLDEIARLLALQIRLSLPSQADAVVELDKIGLGPTRVAELLGTTPGTVNTALGRAKGRSGRAVPSSKGGV